MRRSGVRIPSAPPFTSRVLTWWPWHPPEHTTRVSGDPSGGAPGGGAGGGRGRGGARPTGHGRRRTAGGSREVREEGWPGAGAGAGAHRGGWWWDAAPWWDATPWWDAAPWCSATPWC